MNRTPTRTARRVGALACLGAALAATACSSNESKPATQLLVTVDSDLAVGTQLTRVQVEIRNSGGVRSSPRHTFELTTDKAQGDTVRLPFSFGVTKVGGTDLELGVTGFDADGAVLEQRVNATFEDEKTLGLSVFLGSVCAGTSCPSSKTCYPRAKAGIGAGECGAIPNASMSPVAPGEDLPGTSRDAGEAVDAETREAGSGGAGASGASAGRDGAGSGGMGGRAGANAGAGAGGAGSGGAGGNAAAVCSPACQPGEMCVSGTCQCPTTPTAYYRDSDGDGHGDAAMKRLQCGGSAPSGYVTSSDDCCDSDNRAYPGQLQGDTTPALCTATGFDFDCDGNSEIGAPDLSAGQCCTATEHPGWYAVIPACGELGIFERCDDTCEVEQLAATQRCY